MTFSLDFALLYAYTLCLFAFLLFWLIPQLFRAVRETIQSRLEQRSQRAKLAGSPPSRPQTRLEAFTSGA